MSGKYTTWKTKTNPKYKDVKAPTSKSVRITCDTVADPWFISKRELEANHNFYYNDPTIHIEILDKEEDNAGQEI